MCIVTVCDLTQFISTQPNSIKGKKKVTLEQKAGNVSVAKQWQTARRQRSRTELVKMSGLPAAMQSNMTTAARQCGGLQKALFSPAEIVQLYDKLLANG